jgi:hypothetical protein
VEGLARHVPNLRGTVHDRGRRPLHRAGAAAVNQALLAFLGAAYPAGGEALSGAGGIAGAG